MRQIATKGDIVDDADGVVANIFDAALEFAPFNRSSLSIAEKNNLKMLFIELYAPRVHESLHLWKAVIMLAKLRSIYPPATLHDCVDGNDDNPVRLDNTMLGE